MRERPFKGGGEVIVVPREQLERIEVAEIAVGMRSLMVRARAEAWDEGRHGAEKPAPNPYRD